MGYYQTDFKKKGGSEEGNKGTKKRHGKRLMELRPEGNRGKVRMKPIYKGGINAMGIGEGESIVGGK